MPNAKCQMPNPAARLYLGPDQFFNSGTPVAGPIASSNCSACDLAADEFIEELFLATLCRYPTDEERSLLSAKLEAPAAERRRVVEDLTWNLLNHEEFLFQH